MIGPAELTVSCFAEIPRNSETTVGS